MVRQYSDAECRTLTEAYARLGATVRNPRRTWSAMTDDNEYVILTLWSDLFVDVDRQIYDIFGEPEIHRPEHWRRLGHLRVGFETHSGLANRLTKSMTDAA